MRTSDCRIPRIRSRGGFRALANSLSNPCTESFPAARSRRRPRGFGRLKSRSKSRSSSGNFAKIAFLPLLTSLSATAPPPAPVHCVGSRKILTTLSSSALWLVLPGARSVRPWEWIGIHAPDLSSCLPYLWFKARLVGSCGLVRRLCYGLFGIPVTSILLRGCFPRIPLTLSSNASFSCSNGHRWEDNRTLISTAKLSVVYTQSTPRLELRRLLNWMPHRDGQPPFWS